VFFRLRVIGKENVPRSGPVIVASNHVSYLDPILVGVSLPRRLNYLAKEEIFKNRFFSWFLGKLQAFPVSRGRVGPSTIRNTLQLMEQGRALLLFPEGTRGDGRNFLKAKSGIGIIAERSGAAIIPAYVHGAEKVLPRGSRMFRLHPVTVCFGSPFLLSSSSFESEGGKKKAYGELGERVMGQIESLKIGIEHEAEARYLDLSKGCAPL
jgi:1-acyl-sn-glycerol-3-phosphate acyltransferase